MSGHRKVYMGFFLRSPAWTVNFLEADCKTPIGRIRFFDCEAKVLETAKRGGAFRSLADHQAFSCAIEKGRGGVFLNLTDEQYRKLQGR